MWMRFVKCLLLTYTRCPAILSSKVGKPWYPFSSMDEASHNDPHRRTLLSTWVTEIGVAVVPTGRGDYYFIADFGRPKMR